MGGGFGLGGLGGLGGLDGLGFVIVISRVVVVVVVPCAQWRLRLGYVGSVVDAGFYDDLAIMASRIVRRYKGSWTGVPTDWCIAYWSALALLTVDGGAASISIIVRRQIGHVCSEATSTALERRASDVRPGSGMKTLRRASPSLSPLSRPAHAHPSQSRAIAIALPPPPVTI